MPVFRFDRTLDMARESKAFPNPEGGLVSGQVPDAEEHESRSANPKNVQVTHG